jgi:hypothetical protein
MTPSKTRDDRAVEVGACSMPSVDVGRAPGFSASWLASRATTVPKDDHDPNRAATLLLV